MAEVLGTATAAVAALEQCIGLFRRFRQASRRQKGLPELVEKYLALTTQTKNIVELAASEPALKTPNVNATIVKLADVSEALSGHLGVMTKAKDPLRGFVKQLVSGKEEQEKLDSIMRDLGYSKHDLGMYIQLVNVGLTRAAGETVKVNTIAVDAVNKLLTEKLGSEYSLRIADLVEGRPRDADETVTLTEDDIVALSQPKILADQRSRIIKDNEATEWALQVNTPIGVDVWKDMDSVIIERNKATGNASQWNYPMASVEAFLAALEMRRPAGPG
ncbi:hypothetical protein J3E69DRAFT_337773 [Trichoderma sp. SZMC 28015]